MAILSEIACKTIKNNTVSVEDLDFMKNESSFNRKIFERLEQRGIIFNEQDSYCRIAMPLLQLYFLREEGLITYEMLNDL